MCSFSGEKIRNTEKKQIQPNTNEEANKSSTLQSVRHANDPHTTTSRQLAFQPLISKKSSSQAPTHQHKHIDYLLPPLSIKSQYTKNGAKKVPVRAKQRQNTQTHFKIPAPFALVKTPAAEQSVRLPEYTVNGPIKSTQYTTATFAWTNSPNLIRARQELLPLLIQVKSRLTCALQCVQAVIRRKRKRECLRKIWRAAFVKSKKQWEERQRQKSLSHNNNFKKLVGGCAGEEKQRFCKCL